MSDVFEMDADLMRAASAQRAAHQRDIAKRFDHFVLGDRRASAFHDGHPLAISRIARDRRFNRAAIVFRFAVNDRQIFFSRVAPLGCKSSMRDVVLGDDHHAAGVLVQSMNDSRPQLAADAAEVLYVKHQRVDERAVRVARRRMHDKAGRFVDDHDVRIFKQDFERQIL